MDYLKVLNKETDVAKQIFSVIEELEQTPYENNQTFSNYVKASKKALSDILMSYNKETKDGQSYYSDGKITYYHNGLCSMEERLILLEAFDKPQNEEINAEAMKLAEEMSDKVYVSAQLKDFADPAYKFSQIYSGVKGSFERIISNLEFMEKDLDRYKDSYEESKSIAKDFLKVLSNDGVFYALDQNKIDEYIKTQDDRYLIKKKLNQDAIKAGREIIDFLREQDSDVAKRMRVLNK